MTDAVVLGLIAGMCVCIIRSKVRDIRSGKLSCGGRCARCCMECHKQNKMK